MSLIVKSCTFSRYDLFIDLSRLSNLVFHPSYSHFGLEVCIKNVLVTLRIYLKENLNYSLRLGPVSLFYALGSQGPWVIELSKVAVVSEPSCMSDHLGVLSKSTNTHRTPPPQDIFIE
jgi:hypothetical protein